MSLLFKRKKVIFETLLITIIFLFCIIKIYNLKEPVDEIKDADNNNQAVIYLCDNNDNVSNKDDIIIKHIGDNLKDTDVCIGNLIGKYKCDDDECVVDNDSVTPYINVENGIVSICEDKNNTNDNCFLYNFKLNKTIIDNFSIKGFIKTNQSEYLYNYMIASNNNKYGIINTNGTQITSYKYDNIYSNSDIVDNSIMVLNNEKYGFINYKTGVEIIPVKYNYVGYKNLDNIDSNSIRVNTHEKLAYVSDNNISSVIDITNNNIKLKLEESFDYLLPLDNYLFIVNNGNIVVLDYNLNLLTTKEINNMNIYIYNIDNNDVYFKLNQVDYKYDSLNKEIVEV